MRSILTMLVLALAAVPAYADDATRAIDAYEEGKRLYADKQYEAAAARFEEAYAIAEDPAFLFNIAQAYRFANRCAKSVEHYEKFLAAVPTTPNRADVERYLSEVRACAVTQRPPEPTPSPPVEPRREPPPELPREVDPPRETRDDGGSAAQRYGGAALVVVGAAGVGIGSYYAVRAAKYTDDRDQRGEMWDAGLAADAEKHGPTAQTRARIGLAVGGAAVIGGIVLYMIGRPERASSVALTPTAGGAFATFGGAF